VSWDLGCPGNQAFSANRRDRIEFQPLCAQLLLRNCLVGPVILHELRLHLLRSLRDRGKSERMKTIQAKLFPASELHLAIGEAPSLPPPQPPPLFGAHATWFKSRARPPPDKLVVFAMAVTLVGFWSRQFGAGSSGSRIASDAPRVSRLGGIHYGHVGSYGWR
jgi:hypothetical protein